MQPNYERQSKIKLVSTVLAVIVIAGVVLIADHLKAKSISTVAATSSAATSQQTATNDTTDTNTSSGSTDTTGATTIGSYKDGTYTASSDYYVPHGSENIEVRLTVKDGVVTASSITNSEGDRDSIEYQEAFTSSYKSYVIGKALGSIQLSRVSGASDTTQGFNDALAKIAAQAQA